MLPRSTSLLFALVGALSLAACAHAPPTGTDRGSDDDPMVVRGSATVGARSATPVGPYLGR